MQTLCLPYIGLKILCVSLTIRTFFPLVNSEFSRQKRTPRDLLRGGKEGFSWLGLYFNIENQHCKPNNSHDFSLGKYRKVKTNENNCKNSLTFCYFSRIPFSVTRH